MGAIHVCHGAWVVETRNISLLDKVLLSHGGNGKQLQPVQTPAGRRIKYHQSLSDRYNELGSLTKSKEYGTQAKKTTVGRFVYRIDPTWNSCPAATTTSN